MVFVDDEQPRQLLDTIRFLADPNEKLSAHVTVRGPYKQRQPLPAELKSIEGARIDVGEVGTFFDTKQNTVFLRCDAPELRRMWHKVEFPEYAPHITLYDGNSRSLATRLENILKRWKLQFTFVTDGIVLLQSSKGQHAVDLAAFYDSHLVASATGCDLKPAQVCDMNADERLRLIEKMCRHWTAEPGGNRMEAGAF